MMNTPYSLDAITVVSPATLGGEIKDQDRAEFFSPALVACVCDGVSTSPHASKAAEIGILLSPTLFDGDVDRQLETLSDVLLNQRSSACDKGITVNNQSVLMKTLLQEAARDKLKHSFQTTLVAAKFSIEDTSVNARLVWCGDSAFFAYSQDGDLLFTNLSGQAEFSKSAAPDLPQRIPFGPSDAVVTEIIGKLSDHPDLLEKTSVKEGSLCQVLSSMPDSNVSTGESPPRLWLRQGELLIVPAYLLSVPKDVQYRNLASVMYSPFVQRAASPTVNTVSVTLDDSNNTTEVLPDHFLSGGWTCIEHRFPKDAQYLLCSDGFYRCFDNPTAMWTFLKRYNASGKKGQFIEHLHRKLNDSFGDDDISFIWISPKEAAEVHHA